MCKSLFSNALSNHSKQGHLPDFPLAVDNKTYSNYVIQPMEQNHPGRRLNRRARTHTHANILKLNTKRHLCSPGTTLGAKLSFSFTPMLSGDMGSGNIQKEPSRLLWCHVNILGMACCWTQLDTPQFQLYCSWRTSHFSLAYVVVLEAFLVSLET
jgi:hypothetical protein